MIDQPTLFGDERVPDRAHARRSDPETSHAAAASISAERLRDSQAAVLRAFSFVGDVALSDAAIANAYRVLIGRRMAPEQSPSGLRTRRRELVDLGYLQDSGTRGVLPSGRKTILWERTNRQETR